MLIKESERIYYLPAEEETDRPNLYYIKGDKKSLVIDAGNSPAHVQKFYQEIEALGMPLPEDTVITHWHWDHTFGLVDVVGRTIASKHTNDKLKNVCNWKWSIQAMQQREESGEDISFCNECIQKEYADLSQIKVTTIDYEITEKTILDLGGVTCILEPQDSTHTRDALFIYVPEEKVMFIGDADGPDYYDNQGKYDKQKLEALMKYLKKFDVQKFYIGHDVPQDAKEEFQYLQEEYEHA